MYFFKIVTALAKRKMEAGKLVVIAYETFISCIQQKD